MREPVWLSAELAAQQNHALVEETGENFAIRDWGLLESAVARPKAHWAYSGEEDLFHLACILCFAIAANHPFEQGNKRTGWAAAGLFLALNNLMVEIEDEDTLPLDIISVIVGERTVADFAATYRHYVRPLADP